MSKPPPHTMRSAEYSLIYSKLNVPYGTIYRKNMEDAFETLVDEKISEAVALGYTTAIVSIEKPEHFCSGAEIIRRLIEHGYEAHHTVDARYIYITWKNAPVPKEL